MVFCMSSGNVDIDKDGVINAEHFDQFLSEIAAPLQLGLAPLDAGDAVSGAVNHKIPLAKRELYGFLALSFGEVDIDKDGLIIADQFDQVLQKLLLSFAVMVSLPWMLVMLSVTPSCSA